MAETKARPLDRAIEERLRDGGGRMTFAAYMELCLYHPEGGYYQKSVPKLGKEGDFYTSAHVGRAMGACVAAQLHAAAEKTAAPEEEIVICEWGGGDGRLAEAVLDELRETYPDTYRRAVFLAVEGSPYHRELQRRRLAAHAERLAGVVPPDDEAAERLPRSAPTLLFANELLDAFPVHRLVRREGAWRELYVERGARKGTLVETEGEPSEERLAAWLRAHGPNAAEGQRIEVGLAALDWIAGLGTRLARGFALFADYGDVSEELFGPHRMNGTLAAYRKHTASDDAFLAPGEQDLTAHVNFEWVAKAAEEAGFRRLSLRTQKQFLVDNGILQRLQNHDGRDPFSPAARENRAIRQLLLSDGMSELFKVLTMEKGTAT